MEHSPFRLDACPFKPWSEGRWQLREGYAALVEELTQGNGVVVYKCQCGCSRTLPTKLALSLISGGRGFITGRRANVDRRKTRFCFRCKAESLDIQDHHYAPRNMFADAHKWGTVPLCPACHTEWHQRMNGYRWNARRQDDN